MDMVCISGTPGVVFCDGNGYFGVLFLVLEFLFLFVIWIVMDMYRMSNYRKMLIETGHEDAWLDMLKAQRKYVKTEIAE